MVLSQRSHIIEPLGDGQNHLHKFYRNPHCGANGRTGKARERYLTSHEETRLTQTMKDDLAFLRLPFEVSLHTGLRKNIELLKLKVEHLNFSSRPVFFPVHGGSVEIPSNWLIVVKGKRGKYRLIPMNSKARTILFEAVRDRGLERSLSLMRIPTE